MKIIHLNHTDISGGAARTAYRIHHALRDIDIDSTMWVDSSITGDWTVSSPKGKLRKAMTMVRPHLGRLVSCHLKTTNPILHSPSIISSVRVKCLNNSDANILHLHWVQAEMLSVADIGQLKKPVVWTLHDMWSFCGAEHYTHDFRFQHGYVKYNRPAYERGFDLNRWTWERKKKHWQTPMHIVTPSKWLADCVTSSALMKDWPVEVIANPIDTQHWQPVDKNLARQLLDLPMQIPLLLFGAIGGRQDLRKGFDLLQRALKQLQGKIDELQLVIFGQLAPQHPPDLGFPVHYTGHLHDDLSLRVLYSAVDVFILPSRQDNLPNTGVEALACGTPVVAFNTCGLPDIVQHQQTGYLAHAFEPEDMAEGIQWVLANKDRYQQLSINARQFVVENFSSKIIAQKYRQLYERVLAEYGGA